MLHNGLEGRYEIYIITYLSHFFVYLKINLQKKQASNKKTGSLGHGCTENLVASGDFAIVLNNLLF